MLSCLTRCYDEFGTLMSQAGSSFGRICSVHFHVKLYVGGFFYLSVCFSEICSFLCSHSWLNDIIGFVSIRFTGYVLI